MDKSKTSIPIHKKERYGSLRENMIKSISSLAVIKAKRFILLAITALLLTRESLRDKRKFNLQACFTWGNIKNSIQMKFS